MALSKSAVTCLVAKVPRGAASITVVATLRRHFWQTTRLSGQSLGNFVGVQRDLPCEPDTTEVGPRPLGSSIGLGSVIVTMIRMKSSSKREGQKGEDSSHLWEGAERWYRLDKGRRCQSPANVFYIHNGGVGSLNDTLVLNAGSRFHNERFFGPF